MTLAGRKESFYKNFSSAREKMLCCLMQNRLSGISDELEKYQCKGVEMREQMTQKNLFLRSFQSLSKRFLHDLRIFLHRVFP